MSTYQELRGILQSRREYCRAMLALAERQQTLIEQDQMTELIQVLARKQRVLDGLTRLNELEAAWRREPVPLNAADQAEADVIRAEADDLYRRICDVELTGTQELQRRRDELQSRLRELGEVADALPADHFETDTGPSRFLDVTR